MKNFHKRMFVVSLLLIIIALVGVKDAESSEQITTSMESTSIDEGKPLTKVDRWIKEEKVRIAKFSEYIRRDGDMLYLKLNYGTEKSFKNLTGCNETGECTYYEFKEYLVDLNLYVLDVHFYEGGHYLVMSGISGTSYRMYAYPKVSPDRLYIVAVSSDDMGGGENSIRFWRVEQGNLIEEYCKEKYLGDYVRNDFFEWKDSKTVVIDSYVGGDNIAFCSGEGVYEAQYALRKTGLSWEFDNEPIEGTVKCPPF